MTICPLAPVTEQSNVEAPLLDTEISCFDLNENPDVEITYSKYKMMFFFSKEVLWIPSTGIHLLSGDFGRPIYRMRGEVGKETPKKEMNFCYVTKIKS